MHRIKMGAVRAAVGLAVAIALAACSPAYNWRDVQLAQLSTLLPCKPDRAKRMVALGGQEVELEMLGCETRGTLFVISHIKLTAAQQTTALVAQWRVATLGNMRGTVQQELPLQAKALAVHSASQELRATGLRPSGEAVQAHLAWLASGADVYHLAVYAQRIEVQEAAPFFTEPRLRAP